jgi:hypothetical protein
MNGHDGKMVPTGRASIGLLDVAILAVPPGGEVPPEYHGRLASVVPLNDGGAVYIVSMGFGPLAVAYLDDSDAKSAAIGHPPHDRPAMERLLVNMVRAY